MMLVIQKRPQPCMYNVKSGILGFPGPVVSLWSFYSKRSPFDKRHLKPGVCKCDGGAKSSLWPNYKCESSQSFKTYPHFLKKGVQQFEEWPSQDLCTRSDYESSYNRSCHKSILPSIRRLLLSQYLIMQENVN